MKNIFCILSSGVVLSALFACGERMAPVNTGDGALAEVHLEKAREAEAPKYAPALYGAAVEALEKGETGEEGISANGAENLAIRSVDEAIRVRAEAKEAAHRALRSATVLQSIVEAVVSHDPPRREKYPSDARLAQLNAELARAREAYENGDFAVSGLAAQSVESELAGFGTDLSGT